MSDREKVRGHNRRDEGHQVGEDRLVLPLSTIDHASFPAVGGKAANLGELIRAGFPVPYGFCVTTAAYTLVAQSVDTEVVLRELDEARADDPGRLSGLAAEMRASLLEAPVPAAVIEEVSRAYRLLGRSEQVAVAVRSSATAEDMPHASFAGQQESYLNVVGPDAVIEAVRRCWASLWTDRAVGYRAANGVDHRTVRLAVVVQRMIDAKVAGVLFTADPLTGRRRRAVIDASPGLGEAVVSGAVNPDHFVVDTAAGEILEQRLGDKWVTVRPVASGGTQRVESSGSNGESCLTDDQLRALATLGARVEGHYGVPQDVEWAIDAAGKIWLVQARPITTLFPLPASAPVTDDDLRVYFSINVAQGVYRPLTPMGLQVFRLAGSAIAALFGRAPRDRYSGPASIVEAAGRLFIDVTPLLRSSLGRRLFKRATQVGEARTATVLEQLVSDPRLAIVAAPRWPVLGAILSMLIRGRIPPRVALALLRPAMARARVARLETELRALGDVPRDAGAAECLATVERLLTGWPPRVVPGIAPVFAAGLGAYALAGVLLRGLATNQERQLVLRGLPHNPTTEMDLALWALAQEARLDPATVRTMRATPPERLAQDYRSGHLPPKLQTGLSNFLRAYGHRGVAEIDLGLPRWSEDPTHVLGVLANYLRLDNPELAPDVQFRRTAREAEEMVADLTRRAARKGRLRGALVGFCLDRARALAGLREVPKFYAVLMLARARALLRSVGEELVRTGRLEETDDVFFITLPETRAALAGDDLRPVVRERRAAYEHELNRRHVPRILLSDGTEPETGMHAAEAPGDTIRGTSASSGTVTAKARVILDPTGAHLEPGEILVAPSTDPGWTPLFLTAGGLVMEMGGSMSHGAIVAREFGIPAVVGVAGATERIATGQRITVDGSAGTVAIAEDST